MNMGKRLTHLDDSGRARMVDVGDKPVTAREAVARGRIRMAPATLARALSGDAPKGDIRAIAEIAGTMGGKRTSELIPLCHPISLSSLIVEVAPDEAGSAFVVTARARTTCQTGVEMEALTAVSIACLTIYDMLKAIDRSMVIEEISLLAKSGGASGDYDRSEP
jgi:cyclic pyranopterin phosphate synthase